MGQAEIAPVLVALKVWEKHLRDQHAVFYIDNDAARQGLIRGYSPSKASCKLISAAWLEVARLRTMIWFARVPTRSNIADLPSRGKIASAFAADDVTKLVDCLGLPELGTMAS